MDASDAAGRREPIPRTKVSSDMTTNYSAAELEVASKAFWNLSNMARRALGQPELNWPPGSGKPAR